MVSEEAFAREEERLGKQVHFHDGVWWAREAPLYYKPVHEFRTFPPKDARPHPFKALLGYSHQVPDPGQATRHVRWNVLQGEDLRSFSLERLRAKRRNMVRGGIRDCRVEALCQSDALLEQMRLINISQAMRFEGAGEGGTFLPAEYYKLHAAQWRQDMLRMLSHRGHQFVGAFVGDTLAAYVDLIQIDDTWMFGAVKSSIECLKHRPVDALYFTILSRASQSEECSRVVNGGGVSERKSLTYFKGEFLLKPVSLPYYTRALLPTETLRGLQTRFTRRRHGGTTLEEETNQSKLICEADEIIGLLPLWPPQPTVRGIRCRPTRAG